MKRGTQTEAISHAMRGGEFVCVRGMELLPEEGQRYRIRSDYWEYWDSVYAEWESVANNRPLFLGDTDAKFLLDDCCYPERSIRATLTEVDLPSCVYDATALEGTLRSAAFEARIDQKKYFLFHDGRVYSAADPDPLMACDRELFSQRERGITP